MLNEIKIIGGKFKGKKLQVVTQPGLRPTPNRVRETLFNWLMHDIREANCLDLFAGSGALGLEAYSRQAKHITFIEKNVHCYNMLKKNLAAFKALSFTSFNIAAEQFLAQTNQKFDIIFFDPPFEALNLYDLIKIIVERNLLTNYGLLYIESPISLQNHLNNHFSLLNEKKTQQTYYALYQLSKQ